MCCVYLYCHLDQKSSYSFLHLKLYIWNHFPSACSLFYIVFLCEHVCVTNCLSFTHLKIQLFRPDGSGSVGCISSHKLEGCQFASSHPTVLDFQLGPQARSPVGGVIDVYQCFPPSLSLSFPLSLKINYCFLIFKKYIYFVLILDR